VDANTIKLASSSYNATRTPAVPIDITSAGSGVLSASVFHAGDALWVNGKYYYATTSATSNCNGSAPGKRLFSVAGTDAQDAVQLAQCLGIGEAGNASTPYINVEQNYIYLQNQPSKAWSFSSPPSSIGAANIGNTLHLNSVALGTTVTINGMTFTAGSATNCTSGSGSPRTFRVTGLTDAQAAQQLAACIEQAAYWNGEGAQWGFKDGKRLGYYASTTDQTGAPWNAVTLSNWGAINTNSEAYTSMHSSFPSFVVDAPFQKCWGATMSTATPTAP
jgi:hypothetical protein